MKSSDRDFDALVIRMHIESELTLEKMSRILKTNTTRIRKIISTYYANKNIERDYFWDENHEVTVSFQNPLWAIKTFFTFEDDNVVGER